MFRVMFTHQGTWLQFLDWNCMNSLVMTGKTEMALLAFGCCEP